MLLEGAKFILITSRYKYKLAYGALSWSVELCADDSTHFEDKIEENSAQKQQLFSFFFFYTSDASLVPRLCDDDNYVLCPYGLWCAMWSFFTSCDMKKFALFYVLEIDFNRVWWLKAKEQITQLLCVLW